MSNYTCYVGKQIRKYRKAGKMTLQDLADAIHKSRAKYVNMKMERLLLILRLYMRLARFFRSQFLS